MVGKARATRPRRLRHQVAFKGRVFQVERDVVRLTNGRTVTLDIVRHAQSVALIAQPSPDRIVLIRQFRYAINRWIWELPAGSIEPGERPAAAARRECEEEIGLTPRRVRRLVSFYPTPGICDEQMIFYSCERLEPLSRPVVTDEDEQIEPRTFTLAGARALYRRGGIVDMKTVVGLALATRRL
jgi:ADP-ribose pyrophosphatase